MNQKIIQ